MAIISIPGPAAFALGVLLFFIGERLLPGFSRWVVSFMGLGLISLGLLIAWARRPLIFSEKSVTLARSPVVDLFFIATGLALYFLSLDEFAMIPPGELRDAGQTVWVFVFALGMIPAITTDVSLFNLRRAPVLEKPRVVRARRGAYTLVLSVITFASLNYAADRWNKRIDLSYFKTAGLSNRTLALAHDLDEDVEFFAFFPAGNDVLEHLRVYLDDLKTASPHIQIRITDHSLSPKLSRQYDIRENGILLIRRGERHEKWKVGMDLEKARMRLRDLDAQIHQRLWKVTQSPRIIYFTTGHLERDIEPTLAEMKRGLANLATLLKKMGFELRRLGLAEGLGTEIPKDAAVVVLADPRQPLLPQEVDTLLRYMKKGGALLAMLETDSQTREEKLLEALGLKMGSTLIANERFSVRVDGGENSPYNLATTRFGIHTSVETLRRNAGRLNVALLGSGALQKTETPPPTLKTTFIIKAMGQSWLDSHPNSIRDLDEPNDIILNSAAAISGKLDAEDSELRAIVVGDA
ncbi:Gldg family protein, partial [Myxococcota bacterium]|nr:Gldg family protein [Myxococcota bacterium]